MMRVKTSTNLKAKEEPLLKASKRRDDNSQFTFLAKNWEGLSEANKAHWLNMARKQPTLPGAVLLIETAEGEA